MHVRENAPAICRETALNYTYGCVPQNNTVLALVLTPAPLAMTCEHGRKIEISTLGEVDFLQLSKCISAKVLCSFSEKLH